MGRMGKLAHLCKYHKEKQLLLNFLRWMHIQETVVDVHIIIFTCLVQVKTNIPHFYSNKYTAKVN